MAEIRKSQDPGTTDQILLMTDVIIKMLVELPGSALVVVNAAMRAAIFLAASHPQMTRELIIEAAGKFWEDERELAQYVEKRKKEGAN
jgi:hypothetical protein